MSRALRAAWSRRGVLLTLGAMTLVVVAGAVSTLGFARAAGTSSWLMSPLLLLGAVAIPSIGRELALARREEIGLTRLRGIRGSRLWLALLVEPLVVIALGTALGLALGWLVLRVAGERWLGGEVGEVGGVGEVGELGLGRPAVLAALAIAAGSLVIVLAVSRELVVEPLSVQVGGRHRPRRATTLALFGSVLVLVGAAVAAYRAGQVTAAPDALVLIGPALLGLAAGQVAVWLVRLLARGAVSSDSGGFAGFLASRRLSRADDLVTPMRLLVAAAVVGVLATTGAGAVDEWAGEQSRIDAGGASVVPLDGAAVQALAISERLDPDGTSLMAAVSVPDVERPDERRAYLDTARSSSRAETSSRSPLTGEVLGSPVACGVNSGTRADARAAGVSS